MIEIVIRGPAKSGKTVLASVIRKLLNDIGITASVSEASIAERSLASRFSDLASKHPEVQIRTELTEK